MEIVIAEQGVFSLTPAFSGDEARGRANAQKASVFGTLARLLSRPKDEDITVQAMGLRYEPLWHAAAHLRFVYDRKEAYRVTPKSTHVTSVNVYGNDLSIANQRQPAVDIPVVEHCVREENKELWIDAVTDQPISQPAYGKAEAVAVSLDEFAPQEAQVATPTVRASAVIRKLLGEDFRPIDADTIHEATVSVDSIDLVFRPAYAFRFSWAAKSKTADIAIDGITGETRTEPSGTSAALARLLHPDTLFDLGAETLNVVVPGGAIALKVARAISSTRKS